MRSLAGTSREAFERAAQRDGRAFHSVILDSTHDHITGLASHKAEAGDTELIDAWRRALGAADASDVERRLRWVGLSVEQTLARLRFRDGDTPAWVDRFLTISTWIAADPALAHSQQSIRVLCSKHWQSRPFGELWAPVAEHATAELVDAHSLDLCGPYAREVQTELADALLARLSELSAHALWQEFDTRRTEGSRFLARLTREIGAETTDDLRRFIDEQRVDGLLGLAATYPVLARYLCSVIEGWVTQAAELIDRVKIDRTRMVEYFELPQDAMLSGIAQALGDTHDHGRSVAILTFTSVTQPSSQVRVVYKPRDMRLDEAFQQTLAAVATPGGEPPLAGVRTLPMDGYGYSSFIEHRFSESPEELDAFYRNAGKLTAILHMLGCTDCHHENLIASGRDLILIDTETLLDGVIDPRKTGDADMSIRSEWEKRAAASVLKTGLMPRWAFRAIDRKAYDVSAFGVEPPTRDLVAMRDWVSVNTDAMEMGEVLRRRRVSACLPVDAGERNPLPQHTEALCAGFRDQMQVILESRDRWTAPDGILSNFASLKRRIILRPTKVYSWIIEQLLSAKSLTSCIEQGFTTEHLAKAFLVPQERPAIWPVLRDEIDQTDRLDTPFFSHAVDSRDLELSTGETVQNYFETSGIERARHQLDSLTPERIDSEVELIRAAIALKFAETDERVTVRAAYDDVDRPLSAHDRLAEATRIGNRLAASALVGDNGSTEWVGPVVGDDGMHLYLGGLAPSLYSGYTGVALFLFALGTHPGVTDGRKYTRLAAGALSPLLMMLERCKREELRRFWRDLPLGLAGSAGIILALKCCGRWHAPTAHRLERALPDLLHALPEERIIDERCPDVMSGLAGLAAALLETGGEKGLAIADLAGRTILRLQGADGGWHPSSSGAPSLTGFSHGTAGVVATLARLDVERSSSTYRAAIDAGLSYERSVWNQDQRNWPDFRPTSAPSSYMNGWCHGAPGVALGRLCMLGTVHDDATLREEIAIALATTADRSPCSDRLCCGRFGRSAVLRTAARRLGQSVWRENADVIDAAGVARASSDHAAYDYRVPSKVVNQPGLFVGDAGTGLSLLDSLTDTPLAAALSCGLLPFDAE